MCMGGKKSIHLKTIQNIHPEFDTKHELFKFWVDEISSCEEAIKSDKPNLCVYPLPFICHISSFDLL